MKLYCVAATIRNPDGKKQGKRKAITGGMPQWQAQEQALALRGDPTYIRPTYVPYPYKPSKK